MGRKLVVYSFFAALLLFGIITGTLITPEELTVNYIVFMMVAPLLFTARTAVMNGLILSSMLLYIGLAFFAQHNPILSKNLVDVILYGVLSMLLTATMMRSKLQRILYHKEKEMLEVSKRESQERILNYERFLTDMVRYAASEENPDKVLNQLVEYIGQRVTAERLTTPTSGAKRAYPKKKITCRMCRMKASLKHGLHNIKNPTISSSMTLKNAKKQAKPSMNG